MTDIRAQVIIDGDPRGLRAALAQSEADLAKLDATGKKVEILQGAIQNAIATRAALVDAKESAETLDKQLADARGAGAGKDAIRLLEQALKDANRELRDSDKAWATSRERLDAARAAAAAAGVDTRNLATEQGRLKAELEAATSAVQRNIQAINDAQRAVQERQAADRAAAAEEQRLAAIVEAGIQRQKMAAQELLEAERRAAQETQLAANKIAAGQREAAAAAEALNAAFRQLGVRPLQEVVAETNRLQAALAQVRAAGITSAEQQQAIAAFQTKLAALRAEAHGVAPELASAGAAVQEFGAQTESAAGVVGAAARNLAGMAAAVVGLQGITGLARDVISTGAAFETLEARLSSLLGSTDAARDVFGQIKELAKTTPFEVQGLTESYVKLTAFGLQPSMKQMQAIADTAATLGGGTEALQRVTLALGQAWTKSKLQGDEILQLAEAGVPVWDLLAKATGKNTAELQKMSEAGSLGRGVILKLIDALGQENMGASAKLMATFSGAVSNAHDALDEFYALIAQSGVLDYLTKQMQDLLSEFDKMKASGELQTTAKDIAASFVKMAEGTKTAVEAVMSLSGVIKFGVEAYIGWRVAGMALIPMLGSVGAAAGASALEIRAMGAASAVATVETRTLGAASASSAAGVGILANGLRLLKGLSLVALVTEVASFGMEFFRVKAAAEDADRAIKESLKPAA
ncbi:MAG: tape measure protein, partial [Rhodocyclales bacterium]|nr:tape measure protein [Rhodocyclales bacterium]